jgi:hypothetical protein
MRSCFILKETGERIGLRLLNFMGRNTRGVCVVGVKPETPGARAGVEEGDMIVEARANPSSGTLLLHTRLHSLPCLRVAFAVMPAGCVRSFLVCCFLAIVHEVVCKSCWSYLWCGGLNRSDLVCRRCMCWTGQP